MEITELLPPALTCAVRSSAPEEDGRRLSMAGQYKTILDVRGADAVVDAIERVGSASSGGAAAYRMRHGLGRADEPIGVLIQEMVDPVCAGVAFSRNPVTGADEVVVEAVEGSAEALLQLGATPIRWIVEADRVVSDWPPLPSDVLREIVRTTRRVATQLAYPADLEWAYDGTQVWWLQTRPITSLRGLPVYSNRISREYLPGLVKPLVWSINVPMINGAWVDLFESVVGRLSIDPLSLAKQFHYRAYFNMSGMGELFGKLGLPKDALQQVLGLVPSVGRSPFGFRWAMLRHLARLARFLFASTCFVAGIHRWERATIRRFAEAEVALGGAEEPRALVGWAECFVRQMRGIARARILTLMMHLVVGHLGRRALRRAGIDDPSALEVTDPRLDTFDPTTGLRGLSDELRALSGDTLRKAHELGYAEFFRLPEAKPLKRAFDTFLAEFGHVSESGNDFSASPWGENPTRVLRMAAMGTGDREGASRAPTGGEESRTAKRWAHRVTRRRLDRERVGAIYSKGVYLLHRWAVKTGSELEREGVVDDPEDVFLLRLQELRELVEGRIFAPDAHDRVRQRKAEMAAAEAVELPDLILGDRVVTRRASTEDANVLSGIPASRGRQTGTAVAVRSIDESDRFVDGGVLVVPFSDIAWTPLFARAGAIVAQAGGILSHSSIVAREFGIPAVVSVPNACVRLDGRRVRVDGLEGTITILDGDAA